MEQNDRQLFWGFLSSSNSFTMQQRRIYRGVCQFIHFSRQFNKNRRSFTINGCCQTAPVDDPLNGCSAEGCIAGTTGGVHNQSIKTDRGAAEDGEP